MYSVSTVVIFHDLLGHLIKKKVTLTHWHTTFYNTWRTYKY